MFDRLKSLLPIFVLALVLWSIINIVRQPNTQETSLWNKALKLVGIGATPPKETPRSFEYVPGELKQVPATTGQQPATSYQAPGTSNQSPTPQASPSPAVRSKPPALPPLPKLPPPGSSLGVKAHSVLGTLENFIDSVIESIIGK